jgi:hypothetical protein
MRTLVKMVLVVACSLVVGFASYFGYLEWYMNAPAVPPRLFKKLRVGMSRADIVEILGEPRAVYEGPCDGEPSEEGETWIYHRDMMYSLQIHFSPEGTVKDFYEDD